MYSESAFVSEVWHSGTIARQAASGRQNGSLRTDERLKRHLLACNKKKHTHPLPVYRISERDDRICLQLLQRTAKVATKLKLMIRLHSADSPSLRCADLSTQTVSPSLIISADNRKAVEFTACFPACLTCCLSGATSRGSCTPAVSNVFQARDKRVHSSTRASAYAKRNCSLFSCFEKLDTTDGRTWITPTTATH